MPASANSALSVKQLEGKEGMVIDGRFQLQSCIGVGGFGAVYSATDLKTNSVVACKLEHLEFEWASIELEVEVYESIEANKSERHHEFFPAMIATGVHEDLYRYLIMEMLERSLSQLFKLSPKKLTVRQVAKHAKHLIKGLELMHQSGWIHGDLSLKNVLVHQGVTRLVDFGLANSWRDRNTGAHKPFDDDWSYAGTVRFASIAALKSCRPTRRDDMQSLAYILIYLIRRKLPWECYDETNEDEWLKIAQMKADMTAHDICAGLPVEFAAFLHDMSQLQFDEKPDYSKHRRAFSNLNEKLRAAEKPTLKISPRKSSPARTATGLLERLAASALQKASPLRESNALNKRISVAVDDDQALTNALKDLNINKTNNKEPLVGHPGNLTPLRPSKTGSRQYTANENLPPATFGCTPVKNRVIIDLTNTPDTKLKAYAPSPLGKSPLGRSSQHPNQYRVLSPLRGPMHGGFQRAAPVKPKAITKKIQVKHKADPVLKQNMVLRSGKNI